MIDDVCVIKKENVGYPAKETLFRPSVKYPEYRLGETSDEDNKVYDMVRESFKRLGYDAENFDTPNWNPLKWLIHTGDTVLLKPNMVKHINPAEGGDMDSLITHPSVVAAVVDYVLLALGDSDGEIIIGDAPLQSCDFDELTKKIGYRDLIEFYRSKGANIRLADFRNTKTERRDGILRPQEGETVGDNGVVVRLDKDSSFYGLSKERLKRLRVTCYDPRILQLHHTEEKHEYKIARDVLKADAVINLPKPKSHRKAGMTASMKNMVGICAEKEYLPHHTKGSREDGFDEYEKKNPYLEIASDMLDVQNELIAEEQYDAAKKVNRLVGKYMQKGRDYNGEQYFEGSWYGNDTICRTIADLNKIVLYADKNGVMKETPQRRMFILADMIVSGDGEGPLMPDCMDAGAILAGGGAAYFDKVVCSLMGFDYHFIPTLSDAMLSSAKYPYAGRDGHIISNAPEYDGKEFAAYEDSFKFRASSGWAKRLNSR